MFSKSSQRKASKGSVQIKTSNDRLQLVFSYGGKRHYLSLGFPDTPQNRKRAEMKAREIELDILSGHKQILRAERLVLQRLLGQLDDFHYWVPKQRIRAWAKTPEAIDLGKQFHEALAEAHQKYPLEAIKQSVREWILWVRLSRLPRLSEVMVGNNAT
ncbi:MAG: DUF3596 domain-containing protein [Leptolyngbyaceae cyanobacterium bins.349]|nr:DUF3596 domain-containing protein [Leptolyngbyaceae cyanobacterium bins.349]